MCEELIGILCVHIHKDTYLWTCKVEFIENCVNLEKQTDLWAKRKTEIPYKAACLAENWSLKKELIGTDNPKWS